jgi:hypothetical protein
VRALAGAGAGFLLAVLWFDLMFDVQTIPHRGAVLPEEVLASISAYYRRVTTTARPMNRLIALVMLGTLAAIVIELLRRHTQLWVAWASLVAAAAPIALALAGIRTVPSAVRLGARHDPTERQSALARSICRQHIFCAIAIAALLVLQLAFA